MRCDVRIINGTVIDPDTKTSIQRDVCVHEGFIVNPEQVTESALVFDAADMLVMPGLVDFHVHAFRQASDECFPPDCLLPLGVTAAAEAGSAGPATIGGCMPAIDTAGVRLRAFVDIWPTGLGMHQHVDPAECDIPSIRRAFTRYGDRLIGLKLRFGKNYLKHYDLRALETTLAVAEELGVAAAVHCTDAPVSVAEVCELLRPGDILVHCFEGTGNTILGQDGRVMPEVRAARARGVYMDACNGRMNWTFHVAERALAEGFIPDIISSDLTRFSLGRDPVWGLPYIMSKYLMLGMSLEDIVPTVSSVPAGLMGLGGRCGSLAPGAFADIAVMRKIQRTVQFSDSQQQTRTGHEVLIPQLTLLDGRLVYRNPDTIGRTA